MLSPSGLPELIWDPIAGCIDATVAEKRAKAFCAGTLKNTGDGDNAARFYAAEAAKVIECYLHAAALAGLTLNDVLTWAANPRPDLAHLVPIVRGWRGRAIAAGGSDPRVG